MVDGFGVYVAYVDLEQAEQCSKNTGTGLMRALVNKGYRRERLAACSATSGINQTIRTVIFSNLNNIGIRTSMNSVPYVM